MNQEQIKIKSFKDLIVWQKGHQMVIRVYTITENFPPKEQFGLTNQLRRASVSFTSNIAEGFSRSSFKEKLQFYSTALGSLTEVQNQLLIAKDIGYISLKDSDALEIQTIELSKMMNGLIKKSKTLILKS